MEIAQKGRDELACKGTPSVNVSNGSTDTYARPDDMLLFFVFLIMCLVNMQTHTHTQAPVPVVFCSVLTPLRGAPPELVSYRSPNSL